MLFYEFSQMRPHEDDDPRTQALRNDEILEAQRITNDAEAMLVVDHNQPANAPLAGEAAQACHRPVEILCDDTPGEHMQDLNRPPPAFHSARRIEGSQEDVRDQVADFYQCQAI